MEYRNNMIGFFIKKAFFDGWDNLYLLAALNGIFLGILLLFLVVPIALAFPIWLSVIMAGFGILLLSIWDVVVTNAMYNIADGKNVHFADIKSAIRRSLKLGSLLGGVNILIVVAIMIAIPFYLGQKAVLGIFIGGLLFWMMILATLILQYVPAVFA